MLRVVLALLLATPVLADVSVTLVAEPQHTLPGIPVTLEVTATNDGANDVVLPKGLLLRVVPAQGEPFIARWGFSQEHTFSGAALTNGDAVVAAHSRRVFRFAAADIERAAGWFVDPRLHVPGSYRLEVLLTDRADDEAILRTAPLEIRAAMSAVTTLTVDEPKGDDAELWERLQALARKRGASTWSVLSWSLNDRAAFARDVVQNHAGSLYAAYVLPYDSSIPDERRVESALHVLAVRPSPPNREHVLLFVAQTEAGIAGDARAMTPPDARLAVQMTARARARFAALQREAVDPAIREAARAASEKLAH